MTDHEIRQSVKALFREPASDSLYRRPTMLHLTDRDPTDPALCGHQPDHANPDCVPLRWWNGNRDGVCPECLANHDRPQPTSKEFANA